MPFAIILIVGLAFYSEVSDLSKKSNEETTNEVVAVTPTVAVKSSEPVVGEVKTILLSCTKR